MKNVRILSLIFCCALLGACSTSVTMQQPLDASNVGTMRFDHVSVVSATKTPANVAGELQAAIESRLAKLRQGDKPVTIEATITDYDVKSKGNRALAGPFSGANRMTVSVKVTDQSGADIASFQVDRSSNPGGYGMFYDQGKDTLDSVADGIVDTLSGKS